MANCPEMSQQGQTREKQGHPELVGAGVESPCLIDGEHCSVLQLSAPIPTKESSEGVESKFIKPGLGAQILTLLRFTEWMKYRT